jgi:4-hydroxybutyrate CoA-transferase
MMCTPPDEDGYVSFGLSPLDAAIVDAARLTIAQVNESVPFVKGEGMQCKLSDFDYIVEITEDLPVIEAGAPSEVEQKIAEQVMPYIVDGACIQLGIGGLANAVGSFLKEKKDLGIHTEMFVESMVDLIECGAVTNSRKPFDKGISILGFGLGSKRMYDFADGNKELESRSFGYVNNPHIVSQIDNFVSINATMAVDLLGQCYSESIGFRQYSGTGGQVDFVRGARHSKGGHSFICTPSTMKKKDGSLKSKIILANDPGTVVTTLRTDVQYVVTEYGVAYLVGESIEERAKRLIAIAHPMFREELTADAKQIGIIS